MELHIHIHHHHYPNSFEGDVLQKLDLIIQKQLKEMEELKELQDKVAAEGTVIDSAVTLLSGLKAALDAAGTDPAALKALSNEIGAKTQTLADAITANTPVA